MYHYRLSLVYNWFEVFEIDGNMNVDFGFRNKMKRRERGWEFKERPLRPIHKKYCLDLSQLLEMKEKYRQYRDSILELIEDVTFSNYCMKNRTILFILQREKEEALLAEFERRRQLAVPKEVVSREMKPSSSFGEAMQTNKVRKISLHVLLFLFLNQYIETGNRT